MKALTFVLLLISLGSLHSQGEYIESGQNAYGISLTGGYHPKVIALGGEAGVSNSGIFDFGIGYSFLFGKKDTSAYKSNSTTVSPFAGVHILKQSGKSPVSLSALLRFNIHRLTSKDEADQLSLGSWSIGGAVFHRFAVMRNFQIQPFAAVSLYRPERFPGEDSPDMIPVVDVALALMKRGDTSIMIFKPSVTVSKSETTYSMRFEFVGLL